MSLQEFFPTSPSVAIVGAGAVGGYYGARLAQHGHRVHFILRSDFQAVRDNGWTIQSLDGDFTIPPEQVRAHRDSQTVGPVDLVIVTLKSTSNDQLEPLVRPLLHERTAILTLQNGLGNEEFVAGLFGAERIVGGMAFVCINRVGPGVIHHMSHGVIRLGEFGGGPSPRAQAISDMFNACQVRCEVLASLLHGRWLKLVWNIPFNGLGAVMDLTTDQLIGTDAGTQLVADVMAEVIATARTAGVQLPPETTEQQIGRTRNMGAYQTSTQIDRRLGRIMEVDAIWGKPLAAARTAGVSTPLLESLTKMLRALNSAVELSLLDAKR